MTWPILRQRWKFYRWRFATNDLIYAAAPQLYKARLLGCTHLFSPGYWTEPSAVHDGPPHLIITTDESCGRAGACVRGTSQLIANNVIIRRLVMIELAALSCWRWLVIRHYTPVHMHCAASHCTLTTLYTYVAPCTCERKWNRAIRRLP